MPPLMAWVDGSLVPSAAARVSVHDRGFRSGEGLFETVRVYRGHPFRLDAHVMRVSRAATELGIVLRAGTATGAVLETVAANRGRFEGDDFVARLTVTAGSIDPGSPFPGTAGGGPLVVVTPHRLPAPRPTVRAVTLPLVRELAHLKSTAYLLALVAEAEARRRGGDAALLTDDGAVAEAATANVFAVVGGRLVTPPLDGRLLPGVTRGVVLELAADLGLEAAEERIGVTELQTASEALLTSSVREITAVTSVDGQPIAEGGTGAVTAALRAGYVSLVEREQRGVRGG